MLVFHQVHPFIHQQHAHRRAPSSVSSGQLFAVMLLRNLLVLSFSWLLVAFSWRAMALAIKLLMSPMVSAAFLLTVVNFFWLNQQKNLGEMNMSPCCRGRRRNVCQTKSNQTETRCNCNCNFNPSRTNTNDKKSCCGSTNTTSPSRTTSPMHKKIMKARRRQAMQQCKERKAALEQELQQKHRRRVMQKKLEEQQQALANEFLSALMRQNQAEQMLRRRARCIPQPCRVPMTIEHSKGFVTIKLTVPQYSLNELDLSFQQGGRLLKIAGTHGPLSRKARVLILDPELMDVSPNGVHATLNDGTLTITIARKDQTTEENHEPAQVNETANDNTEQTEEEEPAVPDLTTEEAPETETKPKPTIPVETVTDDDIDVAEDAEAEIAFHPENEETIEENGDDSDAEEDEELEHPLIEFSDGEAEVTSVEETDENDEGATHDVEINYDSWEDVEEEGN